MVKEQTIDLKAWLISEKKSVNETSSSGQFPKLAPFSDINLTTKKSSTNEQFDPTQYFIRGWSGEALSSKAALKLVGIIDLIKEDCEKQLSIDSYFPPSLKEAIFQEFLGYCEHKGLVLQGIDEKETFFKHLKDHQSIFHQELVQFISVYAYRVSIIFFYKIRFISELSKKLDRELTEKELLNPNSFFTSIFKNGSSTELKSIAFISNHYTWFRPNANLITDLNELSKISQEISIGEIVKNISQKTESLLFDDRYYSHALSHKHFGLFLNSLLLNFPIWIEQSKNKKKVWQTKYFPIEAVCCKYTGDFLESLSLSHWLAQENNRYLKWEQILCPEFAGNSFITGQYLKICHELQFITFLIGIAEEQGHSPLHFICSVMKEKFMAVNHVNKNQASFIDQDPHYDRIILNLLYPPKSNPHHYLVSQIEKEAKFLKENAYLYVLSSQKLFVPSQKEKVEHLLKDLTLECCFNLDELKGRGEIAPYIYIFSRNLSKNGQNYYQQIKKFPCLSFRMSGELETFQDLNSFNSELQNFYTQYLGDAPPLFHKELEKNLKMEFYQDAIVEGRLINSTSKDLSKITHPNFFKNLTKACITFDQIFNVKSLARNQSAEQITDDLKTDFPFLIIVDQRNPSFTKLHLTSYAFLEEKKHEYGTNLCHFFGLLPKISTIRPIVFEYFFKSPVGMQIIDLTFRGKTSTFKSKLEGMLIPKLFSCEKDIPNHLQSSFKFITEEEFNKKLDNPQVLLNDFEIFEPLFGKMLLTHPLPAMNEGLNFLIAINDKIESTYNQNTGSLNDVFSRKEFQIALTKLKLSPIVPHHPDVYFDLKIESENELNDPFENFDLKEINLRGKIVSSIILKNSSNKEVIEITSDTYLSSFTQYLLGFCKNRPIGMILSALNLPTSDELRNLIEATELEQKAVKGVQQRIKTLIEQSLNLHVSGKN